MHTSSTRFLTAPKVASCSLLQVTGPSLSPDCTKNSVMTEASSSCPKQRLGLYLASCQHVRHSLPAQVGGGDHVLLSARVSRGHSFGGRHGDTFRHPYRFFR